MIYNLNMVIMQIKEGSHIVPNTLGKLKTNQPLDQIMLNIFLSFQSCLL